MYRVRANGICIGDIEKEMRAAGVVIPIIIGSPAINRAAAAGQNQTWINRHNPATASGVITKVKYWVNRVWYADNMKVGTFYLVSGNTYRCRDGVNIGVPVAGSEQTVNGLSIAVQVDDFIGAFWGAWTDVEWSGVGNTFYYGDLCNPGNTSVYYVGGTAEHVSLGGTGS